MGVLLVTTDPLAAAAVERCAAAAASEVESSAVVDLEAGWQRAALVLIGDDVVDEVAAMAAASVMSGRQVLPQRAGVIVVGVRQTADAEPDGAIWRAALGIGAEHVVLLPKADRWLVDRMGAAEDGQRARGRVIAVVGACGGVGASTLALALGSALHARGRSTIVIDTDDAGGGLEVLAGTDGEPGSRWGDLQGSIGTLAGRIGPATLHSAFPSALGPSILSVSRDDVGCVDSASILAITEAGRHAFDAVILDVARDRWESLLGPADTVDAIVLLTVSRVRAVLAARQLHRRLGERPVLLALHRVKGGAVDAIDAEGVLGAGLAVEYASERSVLEAGEHGDPLPRRGTLITAASRLLDRIDP